MPELTEAMYCHQQICIPPTYPYLLRQYAKAAIRSQPSDLLRWSCAYFRALAIGLKPPVKIRLEYPIICTHYGLTPGWLKTLILQFAGYVNVTWPQLYDRWRGICLQVSGLQEIVMMGGFTDPTQVSWLRFVACAAAHLTANLTNTMILICELLTEEPEGGSAMIPYPIFADLYRYLAALDGCDERMVHNFYFTESNLDLTKKELTPAESEKDEALDRSLVSTEEEGEDKLEGETPERRSDLEKYLREIADDGGEEEILTSKKKKKRTSATDFTLHQDVAIKDSTCYIILDPEDGKICKESHSASKTGSSEESSESSQKEMTEVESKSTVEEEQSIEMYQFPEHLTEKASMESISLSLESSISNEEFVDFKLPVVVGIGPVVPLEMVEDVLKYMKECANRQQGMVMPRNIKHFLCPPLEICRNTEM